MKVLNLYAGLGGNRHLIGDDYHGTAIEVTAVEHDHKIADYYMESNPNDTIVISDAHEFLLHHFEKYDVIWSSPPCQSHSRMTRSGRNRKPRYRDFGLYEEVDFLTRYFKGAWLVENVIPSYEPLIPGVKFGRHMVWSSVCISGVPHHASPDGFINRASSDELKEWLGMRYDQNIYYDGNHCPKQVLRNCVHPINGKALFSCLFDSVLGDGDGF